MILLTGATGVIGSAVLRRLVAAGTPVRCLVRDPKRLGPERVRVQLALGDLADPGSFRNALRGVDTVVHLAAAGRDQSAGSIEELTGIATWRLVQAAEKAGVKHFVFAGALGATAHSRARFLRAKALAEQAVAESDLRHTILAPSLVYAPYDRHMTMLARAALLPVLPVSGGSARFQPIWADDVADCALAVVQGLGGENARHELAGPDTLSHDEIVRLKLRASGRSPALVHLPDMITSRVLRVSEMLVGSKSPTTWDEVELTEVSMTTPHGTAHAEALGVVPRRMPAVLGAA